jgi:hypothetical protein
MPFGIYFQVYPFVFFIKEGILCYVISHVLKKKALGDGKHERWFLECQLAMMVDVNINVKTYSK